jgi:hypothetical protein
MNAFAEAQLRSALFRMESAIIALENHADGASPTVLGDAYRNLLHARGQLHAMRQLLEMEAELAAADTAIDLPCVPKLTVVR